MSRQLILVGVDYYLQNNKHCYIVIFAGKYSYNYSGKHQSCIIYTTIFKYKCNLGLASSHLALMGNLASLSKIRKANAILSRICGSSYFDLICYSSVQFSAKSYYVILKREAQNSKRHNFGSSLKGSVSLKMQYFIVAKTVICG